MHSRHPWREQGAASGGPSEPSGKAVATLYNLFIVGPLKTLVPLQVREVQNLIKYQFVDGGRGKREGKRNRGSILGPLQSGQLKRFIWLTTCFKMQIYTCSHSHLAVNHLEKQRAFLPI